MHVSTGLALKEFEPPLDAGIRDAVGALRAGGVETFESCEGGPGHAFPEPTIRFHGDETEGYRAFTVAIRGGLKVLSLRRAWQVAGSDLVGPHWEMTFLLNAAPM
jgi:hypothetical protein